MTSTSTLTVDLHNYSLNLEKIRGRLPNGCDILAVVKANAYGLGAVPTAKRAIEAGVAMLGVATVAEGTELREAGIEAPILVLMQPRQDDLPIAVKDKLRVTLSDLQTAEWLGDIARKAKSVASVHCEIDTGMGRQGFALEEAPQGLSDVTRISNVDIEGVFTHFPSADIAEDPFTENQIRSFRQLLKQLDKDGIPYEAAHAANSAAIFNYPQSCFDMVRAGLCSYGVWSGKRPDNAESLERVVTWETSIVLIRDMPGGASVSYGRTYRVPGPTKLAAVPVGYADGYPFALSNRGDVLIRGKRCRVRGRVTMNEMMVDVTDVPDAAVGDNITLIGQDGTQEVTVEELAERADTIPYEIITGLGAAVAREYRP